ncbi:hypothetical protein DL240_09015 [Lujinxingia litoralis]|uniref:RES domain-containing protein n=1 Tax=Lujinxingia litoralis TaxID=2211119 RepID=A0A328C857_9DELT|nr:RES family NAD+ phosphorylase [Lujinxingia litoralis]RAL23018.1 hypothetical protein DL240_09015 [Lujinxingia litoralis]
MPDSPADTPATLRELPESLELTTLKPHTPLYRIQAAGYPSPIFFGRGPHARFNDPAGEFGVCYVSTSPEGAFVETLGRGKLQGQALALSALDDQILYQLTCTQPLRVVRLDGHYLLRMGLESSLINAPDYMASQHLAARLFHHRDQPDALRYPARHDLERRSLALFERASTHAPHWVWESQGSLLANRSFLEAMVERYQLAITT